MMPSLDEQELGTYLDELTRATQDGLINWRSANPTTYVWDKSEAPSARLSLQQVERPEVVAFKGGRPTVRQTVSHYVFQVFEAGGAGLVLRVSMDGSDSEELNEKMRGLFQLIRNEKTQKDLEFLRKTLPQRK